MKILDGRELAGFIKERQAHEVNMLRGQGIFPTLLILRDSDNPVITKYVNLKKKYGEDIGISVIDKSVDSIEEAISEIKKANSSKEISGIIVQLPLKEPERTDEVVNLIAPEKDVDGLNKLTPDAERKFDSATATAINWLLTGYNIELAGKKIAIVGRGRLVGMPLERMWKGSGLDVTVFHHGDDLTKLREYAIIVSATGVPHLISSGLVAPGTVLVDAGTASEGGVLVGDMDDSLRGRNDLAAITPKIGGVGPLTVGVLFEDVIQAASETLSC